MLQQNLSIAIWACWQRIQCISCLPTTSLLLDMYPKTKGLGWRGRTPRCLHPAARALQINTQCEMWNHSNQTLKTNIVSSWSWETLPLLRFNSMTIPYCIFLNHLKKYRASSKEQESDGLKVSFASPSGFLWGKSCGFCSVARIHLMFHHQSCHTTFNRNEAHLNCTQKKQDNVTRCDNWLAQSLPRLTYLTFLTSRLISEWHTHATSRRRL